MNNKGQVLVIFVILLPIILLLLTFVVDLGLISIERKKIDNNVMDATKYYVDNINDINVKYKVEELLNSNLDNAEIIVNDTENYIEVTVNKTYKCVFAKFLENDIKVTYKVNKDTKKIIKG